MNALLQGTKYLQVSETTKGEKRITCHKAERERESKYRGNQLRLPLLAFAVFPLPFPLGDALGRELGLLEVMILGVELGVLEGRTLGSYDGKELGVLEGDLLGGSGGSKRTKCTGWVSQVCLRQARLRGATK